MSDLQTRSCQADGKPLRPLSYKQLWLLGLSWLYRLDLPPMVVTKEDLLAHSRYIRDTLVPRLAKGSNVVLGKSTFDLAPLRSALEELHKSPMTVEILSFSRIEKALQKIVEARGSGWPPDIVSKARDLTVRWEESLGSLQRVKTDLWGLGGRLEGLAKPGKSLWKGHANLQVSAWS